MPKIDPRKMLADLKQKAKPAKAGKYDRHKEQMAAASRERVAAGQECGPLPPVKNPARKAACGESLRLFCETYFQAKFYLGWSADHLKVIERLETCVRGHGLFALAMPRGSGKTELSKRATEWAILYGYRRFVILVGAAEDKAEQLMRDIKFSFEANELLAEDFPEACHPIHALQGETRKCLGQRLNGERTRIEWKQEEIRFPLVKGSKCSGAVIRTAGLTGAIRGASTTSADGGTMRPDLAILDDPQTRKSAGSLTMNDEREAIIRGDVLGLAGPDQSVTCIMPCTVVYPGDLADRMLSPDRNPQWNGQRMKRVYAYPTDTALWDQYANIRSDGQRAGDNGAAGNRFYEEHRAEMDAGCVLAWPSRFDKKKSLSAIQEAMNRKIEDPLAHAAEDQNEPLETNPAAANALDAEAVAKRIVNVKRHVVPRECTRLTAMIDVGDHLHWYAVVAWDERFGGTVIDYGPYPDQGRTHFHSSNPSPGLGDLPDAANQPHEFAIQQGLAAVCSRILGKTYRQEETGSEFRVERCLIDANNGPRTDLIYQFCRRSEAFSTVLLPSHGKFYGASSKPMGEWTPRDDERPGPGWMYRTGGRHGRHITVDTNYWKTFVAERLTTAIGTRGALSLFTPEMGGHWMLGEHCAAEYPVAVEAKGGGREVNEWKHRPGRDNHLWDCLVGATVAASFTGLRWAADGEPQRPKTKRKRIDIEELYRKQQGSP